MKCNGGETKTGEQMEMTGKGMGADEIGLLALEYVRCVKDFREQVKILKEFRDDSAKTLIKALKNAKRESIKVSTHTISIKHKDAEDIISIKTEN